METAGDLIAVSGIDRLECRLEPIRNGDARPLRGSMPFFARRTSCGCR